MGLEPATYSLGSACGGLLGERQKGFEPSALSLGS